jgi:hypothetical protein
MAVRTHNYATLSTPGTKKISVCARRIGSRDRMAIIAVCSEELNAEKIVTALNLMQGEVVKLEIPAQRTLEEVRTLLTVERACSKDNVIKHRAEKSALEVRLRNQEDNIRNLDRKVHDLGTKLRGAEMALAAANAPVILAG